MNLGGINYHVDADISSLLELEGAVGRASNKMVSEFDKADAAIKKFEAELRRANMRVLESGKVVNVFGQINQKATDELARLNAEAAKASKVAIPQQTKKVQQLNTQLNATTREMRGLRGAMGNLGFQIQDIAVQMQMGTDAMIIFGQQGSQIAGAFGPGGAMIGAIIAIGAALGSVFTANVEMASQSIEEMLEQVEKLTDAEKEYLRVKIQDAISEQDKIMTEASANAKVYRDELERQQKTVKDLEENHRILNQVFGDSEQKKVKEYQEEIRNSESAYDQASRKSKELKESMESLNDELRRSRNATKESESAFTDLAKSLSEEIALIGKNEREQAKLNARFKLGSAASDELIESIDALIDIKFDLKDADDNLTESEKRLKQEFENNEKIVRSIAASYEVASLKSRGMDKEAAKLAITSRLGANATKAQREEVERYADALAGLQTRDLTKMFGESLPETDGFFTGISTEGTTTPRIQQLMNERELILELQALEFGDAQAHAERLKQIDEEIADHRMHTYQTMASAMSGLFGGAADLAKSFLGESSSTFKALFGISKGFELAMAGLNLSGAIMKAYNAPEALTTTQRLANAAAIASAAGSVMSTLSSVTYGGARQYGGNVQAGQAYRVNENSSQRGFEMFTSGGQQYMVPDKNGKVSSGGMATGGVSIVVNQSFNVSADALADPQAIQRMANLAEKATYGVLQKESRPGGLLGGR